MNNGVERWLKTGDRASIDSQGFLRIIGRIKDIIVLANGEKVPPSDIEAAISQSSLFEQVMVLGESRAYLAALLVLNKQQWQQVCRSKGFSEGDIDQNGVPNQAVKKYLLRHITQHMQGFPGYAKVRAVAVTFEEWTVESGLLTPTLKLKRLYVEAAFAKAVEQLYKKHELH